MGGWIFFAYIIGCFVVLGFLHWRRSRWYRDIDPGTGAVVERTIPRPEPWLARTYLICYSIYALLLPITIFTGVVWIVAMRALLPLTPLDNDWHDLAFFLSMFLIWLLLVVIVGGGEIYMRNGFERHLGYRRLGYMVVALVGCLGVGALIVLLTHNAMPV